MIELPEKNNFLLSFVLHLSPVLTEALKLVHKLVDHVPQPLVRQLHIDHAVQNHLEKTAVIVPGVDSLLQRRLKPGVQVAEPHLTIKEAEDVVIVDVVSDGVDGGPRGFLEESPDRV